MVPSQLKFLIVESIITKWIETEAFTKITVDRVHRFYWQKFICRYELPWAIVSDNGTMYARANGHWLLLRLGSRNEVCVRCTPSGQQSDGVNKQSNFEGTQEEVDDVKGLWAELLHKILWLYHTTSHSTTKETSYAMVYRTNDMLHVEINTPFKPTQHWENGLEYIFLF